MKVDAYSTLPHYSDHIRPVWEALPPEARGTWFTPAFPLLRSERPILVASFRDAEAVGRRRVIHLDHGCSQTYNGDPRSAGNGSYAGGEGLGNVILFIVPSERAAHEWKLTYGATPAVAVGCPRLDRYYARSRVEQLVARRAHNPEVVGSSPIPATGREADPYTYGGCDPRGARETPERAHREGEGALVPPPIRPTVAVTFHSDLSVCPETRSAWRHYDASLEALCADPRWQVLGHGHPRLWPTIKRRWEQLGVEHTPDVDEVLSRADLLVMDNTSVGYEAAALGIPVLCLNMPSYRRDVEHGGRFWSSPPGVQCDRPSDLLGSVALALTDQPSARAIRAKAVEWAYGGPLDGHASERAVAAILEVLSRG